ncbi:unnamed protein product [Notodromas monacha]|uniref:ShKT domain-containing protein n=1 Tax=Notodromas monacha TaxID=399045 RepID=A0A7R9BLI9_9CRUS|nr:unnamed protein product [Notodromas monacha]CAG0916896.1 unnamed protein product [Notodromas monacha]
MNQFSGIYKDRPVSTWASQVKKTPQSPQSEAEQEAKTYILCCKMWLYIVFAGLVGLVTGMPHLHHNVGTSKSNHLTIEDFIAAKNDDFSFQEAQEDVLNGRNPELGEHFEGDIILPEGVNPQVTNSTFKLNLPEHLALAMIMTDISKLNLMYKCKVKDAMNEGKSCFACTDKNGHCQFWASEGECDTHKEFMAEECPESCANQ